MEGTTATLELRVAELEHESQRVVFALLDLVDVVGSVVHELTAFDPDPSPLAPVVALSEAS